MAGTLRPPGAGSHGQSMRIGFDAKRAFHNATGLGNYARDVLRILHAHRPELELFAYSPARARLPFRLDGPRFHERLPRTPAGRAFPALWRARGVVRQLRDDRVALYHGLSAELPLGLAGVGVRGVVTVHDVIFERLPALYAAVDRRIYRWKTRSACARADLVLAVSGQTADDLVALYGVPRERIRVVYQGCHAAFRAPIPPEALAEVARARGLARPFVLQVGTIEARKNLLATARAVAGLPGVDLVAIGRETAYAAEVRAEARALGLGDRFRILAGVPLAELAAIYRLAAAVAYPSRYEGFGIPILEALASGTPVVTTRGGCFEEAGGPGAVYVDPDDVEGLRARLRAILEDAAHAAELRRAGLAHAERFRDEVLAADLAAAYAEALRA